MQVTVYVDGGPGRDHAVEEAYRTYLHDHGILTEVSDQTALRVLEAELAQPGSEIPSASLLAFDRGFGEGLPFCRRRRLVDALIRTSHHAMLLCP